MEKKIILVTKSVSDFSKIIDEDNETKKIALDYASHKNLLDLEIRHDISDNFLSYDERLWIFDKVRKLHSWYDNSAFSEFEFEGVNLLGLLDRIELHTELIKKIVEFWTIKKILDNEEPTIVECPIEIKQIIKSIKKEKSIEIIINSNKEENKVFYDSINYKKNIGGRTVSIKIGKNKYNKLKKIIDKTVSTTFGLWFDFKNKDKKTILLLEIFPPLYQNLLKNLNDENYNIIVINQRRPVTLDKESIKIMKESNCKLVSKESLIKKDDQKRILEHQKRYSKKLEDLWDNHDEIFEEIFMIDEEILWPIIKNDLKKVFSKRINDYIESVTFAKKIFEEINVKSILSLNDIGETEQIFLNCKTNSVSTFILEHGFQLMFEENKRFGTLSSYDSFTDNYLVWSDFQKQFLISNYNASPKKVISVGSPRHDHISLNSPKKNKKKSYQVLVAPTPVTPIQGFDLIEFHEKFEKVVQRLCTILNAYDNVDLIFKIHPRTEEHNNEIIKIIKKYSKNSIIYFFNPIIELIKSSDFIITISPEGWCPSTVVLESMIMEKPTMNIILDKKLYEFEYIKQKAVVAISDESDIEEEIRKIIFDNNESEQLIENGKKFVKTFLKNYGNSSHFIANLLKQNA